MYSVLSYPLALIVIVLIVMGITPPAKNIGTTPNPALLLIALSLCAGMMAFALFLFSPLRGYVFVVSSLMLWTEITHFALKIPYDKFSGKGILVAAVWLAVIVPALFLIDPAAAKTMAAAYIEMWGLFVQLSNRIIEVISR